MANDFDIPAELRFDPMFAAACVSLVDPKVSDSGELVVSTIQQQRYTSAILHIRRVHFGTKDQATGIDEDVAFAAIDAFGAIVATDAANASCANRLTIDDRSARLRVAADAHAELLTENSVEMLPRTVHTPQPEIMVSSLPSWELVRK
jgi:hypothetical protein